MTTARRLAVISGPDIGNLYMQLELADGISQIDPSGFYNNLFFHHHFFF